MADFIAELPQKPAHLVESLREQWWTLHVDETSRASSSGIGLILESPTEELVEQAIRFNFSASNNEAKYEAILVRLDLAITLATTRLEIRSDSQLIFGQIQKEYEANDERMACYLTMVKDRLKKLDKWVVRQVPRNENLKVDTLAGIATTLPIRKSSNATRLPPSHTLNHTRTSM